MTINLSDDVQLLCRFLKNLQLTFYYEHFPPSQDGIQLVL